MLEVAEHYYHFDGRSPINDQNRALIEALRPVVNMPIYWGNRNWHPMLADTMRQMRDDGIKRAVAFVTSAFGSYSGCRQYIEDIERARGVDETLRNRQNPAVFGAPQVHRGDDRSRARWRSPNLPQGRLVFTAHSVPVSMAESSPYVRELERACAAVAQGVGRDDWKLVYQSRSGPPGQPWLEPDIGAYLREIRSDVVIVPIGFLSDHMEVLYDLDTEARAVCEELGVKMVRAGTVGTHPAMIEMIAEMVEQDHAPCAEGCCAAPRRRKIACQTCVTV